MSGIRYMSGRIGFGQSRNLILTNWHKNCEIIRNNDINRTTYSAYHKSRNLENTIKQNESTIDTVEESSHSNIINEHTTKKLPYIIDKTKKRTISKGPDLADFILAHTQATKYKNSSRQKRYQKHPYLRENYGPNQKVYFDVYGCQMNVNDTEVVWSILKKHDYNRTLDIEEADIILIVTCAIREGAEQKIWGRLDSLNSLKLRRHHMASKLPLRIGVLGCMAERLKEKILDKKKMVDIVAGPDSYRDLPRLLSITESHETAINVALSFDETYADITPVRLNPDSLSAFVTIMRGCDNMCTYCIVPFVRGKERSRPVESIIDEVKKLSDEGIKEVTLLGQNVNSYRDLTQSDFYQGLKDPTRLSKGFITVYKPKIGGLRFSDLLDKVSLINPEMRIRFTSPHPKDFPDEVIQLISERPNICKQIHLPAQSGNSNVLERMRRGYTRESYLELVNHIREIIPSIKFSSDFIAGFCGETENEFNDTLTLMEAVEYHNAYLFAYSLREKTTAHRRLIDDVSNIIKNERLQRMISLFRSQAEKLNRMQVGTQQLVLIEGESRKSTEALQGRTDGNTRVIIPNPAIPSDVKSDVPRDIKPGDYIVAQICGANSNSLTGIPLYHSTISDYHKIENNNCRYKQSL